MPLSPSDFSPLLHLLAKIDEAISDRLAELEMSEDGPADTVLPALRTARQWLIELGEREVAIGEWLILPPPKQINKPLNK